MVESNNKESFFSEFPITPQTMIVGALILVVYYRFHKLMEKQNEKEEPTKGLPTEDQALKLIMSRRTIMPKEYLLGVSLDEYEIDTILEAANWAPTHHKTEPWRFAIIKGSRNIERYLDFLEEWYDDHDEEVADEEQTAFKNKLLNVRAFWSYNVSHLILIGMKRQAKPNKRLPEWEEICAVACAVQNMHLMATSMNHIGAFWSSHTWCKSARDSMEIREKYFGHLLEDAQDRVFGALVLGRYQAGKLYRSNRSEIEEKIIRHYPPRISDHVYSDEKK